ncbi:MAG: NAD+ synthase [Xanthomonadales bacterium]|nr:NAD+ synthase [Xanthomonadales bacterium]
MLKIALAQFNFAVGDIDNNLALSRKLIAEAAANGADLIFFPELSLSGYPPEDLLLRPSFLEAAEAALKQLAAETNTIDVIIGHPSSRSGQRFNCLSWISAGSIRATYQKQRLPNYLVFDEHRYFQQGSHALVIDIKGHKLGLLVCEDSWSRQVVNTCVDAGAEILLVANASPYARGKFPHRLNNMGQRCQETNCPMIYLNTTGGQDELVFDGRSMLISADGGLIASGPLCEDVLLYCQFDKSDLQADWPQTDLAELEEIYQVLVTGLRDYVHKNGFSEVVLGLSGGIDSALTLILAYDALGADNVHTIMMPSRHTSQLSLDLAIEQADLLGIDHRTISIEPSFRAFLDSLDSAFADHAADTTEENIQARCRGVIVMAMSNKFGWLPLSTGNKSELAVGYSTIYGDMAGGFAPIKDCAKTLVVELCNFRNTISPAIPQAVIDRPPSAELAPDQKDEDSLPPYPILDAILEQYVEQDHSVKEIVAQGFDPATVERIAAMVLMNEYKRRQAAPGVRITARAFGRDRRYPITSGWRDKF